VKAFLKAKGASDVIKKKGYYWYREKSGVIEVFNSVKKTGRLIVADTGWKMCGITAEVTSRVVENVFGYLLSPVIGLGLLDTPAPTSSVLEKVFYPDHEDIVYAAKKLILGKKVKKQKRKTSIVDEEFKGPF